ncbi:zinc finger BED domain-containing protein 4-like [Aphis gossypii]|uniref:zinc finger BED domain-containing protein 4-like n=1 Tax=Aphis gossypii TaxID=80765 RepID=UPI002159A474|nr:zinc finger BED domain-containing protein 4-like [Aphis gossypii]
MSRSDVWKFFDKKDNKSAVCNICQKTLKTSGNTSNLNGHLKNVHGNIFSVKVKQNNAKANTKICSVERTESEEQHETNPDDPGVPGPSTSNTNIDESTENSDKEIMKNTTQITFMSSFKRQKTINESFAFLSSFKEGGQKSEKITHAIMYMVCKDNQPLSIVEDKGFVHLMNTRSHIGITIHFVENYTVNSGLLGVFELDERHTSQYIASKLLEVCDQWNISTNSIVVVTTDGAANMIKGIESAFDKERYIVCFAHTLNLVVQHAISSVPELTTLISKVKNIVRWFKQSVVASDDLRKATKGNGNGKLLQEVPTRWNSTFYMLERFICLKQIVNDIVHRHVSAPEMVLAKEIQDISDIIDILRPVEAAKKELCAQKFVTTSMVIPMVYILQKNVSEFKPKQEMGLQLKAAIILQCDKYFSTVESCSLLGMATVLDPRFKKLYFKDPSALSNMLRYISNEIKHTQTMSSSESSSDTDNTTVEEPQAFNLWQDHAKFVQQSTSHKSHRGRGQLLVDSEFPSELNLYLKSSHARLSDDPLLIWKDMCKVYPILSKMAIKYLVPVATSVPSERLFSKAGLTLSKQRNRLTSNHLNQLLFLQSLDDTLWLVSTTQPNN